MWREGERRKPWNGWNLETWEPQITKLDFVGSHFWDKLLRTYDFFCQLPQVEHPLAAWSSPYRPTSTPSCDKWRGWSQNFRRALSKSRLRTPSPSGHCLSCSLAASGTCPWCREWSGRSWWANTRRMWLSWSVSKHSTEHLYTKLPASPCSLKLLSTEARYWRQTPNQDVPKQS